jgi:L-alanine-DL-glutamate epimerase-like enolase superfamily enzyme
MQEFLKGIETAPGLDGLSKKILYIEQPFNFEIDNLEQWEEVKSKSSIKILADESFRN